MRRTIASRSNMPAASKLYVPVENIDVLTRYGSDSDGRSARPAGRRGVAAAQEPDEGADPRDRRRADQDRGDPRHPARRMVEADSSYPAFVDRFPYDETDDQDRAIDEVIDDLAAGRPMDRLVCGDVGFGKTEVALRAAFVTAMSGMQVALVGPTTLLARQHYTNFVERFHGFPIKIGRLSRLVPAAEAKATREGLENGTIDIVIGTHAILGKVGQIQEIGPRHCRRGAAFRGDPQGAAEGAQERRPCADPDRDADPADAADGDVGPARIVGHPDPAGRPAGDPHLRHAVGPGGGARGAAARALSRRAELLRRAAHRRHRRPSRITSARKCPR